MFQSILTFQNWPDIKQHLAELAEKKLKAEEIVIKILLFKHFSHLSRQKQSEAPLSGMFPILSVQYEQELPSIYSKIATFLLKRPAFKIPIFNTG